MRPRQSSFGPRKVFLEDYSMIYKLFNNKVPIMCVFRLVLYIPVKGFEIVQCLKQVHYDFRITFQ